MLGHKLTGAMWKAAGALLIAMLFIPHLLTAQQSKLEEFKAHKYMLDGIEEYERRNFDAAVRYFNEAVKYDYDNAEIYRYRGESFFGMYNFEAALTDFNTGLRFDPGNAELFNRRGMALARLNRNQEALRDFERALQIDPNFEAARANRDFVMRQQSSADSRPYSTPAPATPQRPAPAINDPFGQSNPTPSPFGADPFGGGVQPTVVGNRTYTMPPVRKAANDYVTLDKVEITAASTVLTFTVIGPRNRTVSLRLEPPESPEAFYLTDRSLQRKYLFKGANKLKVGKKKRFPTGKAYTFSLEFERLHDDVNIFHMWHGNRRDPDDWNFYEVELRMENMTPSN